MVEDSTHTHERVAYRMYATAGVTAPRANLAKLALHVQGQPPHYASYLNLEGYNDKRFLEEIFPSGTRRAVKVHPNGGQFDFVRLTTRTPHGAYVW